MKFCPTLAHATVVLTFCAAASAEQLRPILRVDADGPMSFGRAVAFDRDGTLYAGGWDQLVRAWTNNAGNYALDPAKTIRVPIGPGLNGAINAMATSPDGRWIAVAGLSVARGTAGFDVPGRIVPAKGNMSKAMRADQGTIFLMDTHSGEVSQLRGHLGEVLALRFAAQGRQHLISAGVARFPANRDGQAVVRIWDVESKKYVRGAYLDVAKAHVVDPPQLASVAHDGDLKVAVAWNDGQLRWWDLQSGTVSKYATGTPQTTKTVVMWGDRMVTGGNDVSTRRGRLTTWAWNGTAFRASRQFDTQPAQGAVGVPQALNVVRHRGERYLVATIQSFDVQNGRAVPTHVELHVIHAETGRGLLRHRLWETTNGTVDVPSIAVSPDDRVIAIAGGAPGHGVQLFRTDDLAQAVVKPLALRSRAASPSRAWFVRKEQQLALAIGQANSQRDFVFDPVVGKSRAVDGSWVRDEPSSSGWVVEQLTDGESRLLLRVRTPQGGAANVRLPEEQEAVTAYALAPTSPLGMPLLAVASHQKGQPMLALYELQRGEQVRQCTGHTETIGSLAFSRDGRLLASTASDHTVRIWNTKDLAETLGVHGALRGVRVEMSDDGNLTVAEVDGDASLRVGDQLHGHATTAGLSPWKDPAAFYESWWDAKPGSNVSVRFSRSGVAQQADVRVQQGVDERKPLFSLFLADNPAGLPRQWIGWSPLGLFESSDSEVERFLGWHFNTPDEATPTRFAELSEYRDDFYRAGLLGYLLKHGVPPTEVPNEPPPPPTLSLTAFLEDVAAQPRRGEVILRARDGLGIVLTVDPRFPQQLIGSIECQVNGKSLGEMQPSETGLQWGFDLSSLDVERGTYAITTTLRTNETVPRRFRKSLRLRYQPPAPQLEITSQPGAITTSKFEFAARVTAANDEPVNVELFRRRPDAEPELVKAWSNVSGNQDLLTELDLDVGRHQLDLVARNANASEVSAALETTERSLILERAAAEINPPQLGLLATVDGETSPVEEGQFVYVEVPRLEVQGTVTNDEPVQSLTARWEVADGTTGDAEIEMRGSSRRFRYQLPRLLSGDTQVWVTATAESGAKAESFFQVNYQPPLPVATITQPSNATDLWIQQGGEETVPLVASLLLPDDPEVRQDVKAALSGHVTINGERMDGPIAIDIDRGLVTGELPLKVGENVIELHLQQGPIRHRDEVIVTCFEKLAGEVAQPEQRRGAVQLVGIPRSLEPTVVEDSETGERLKWRRRDDGEVEVLPVAGLSKGFVARVRFSRLPAADFTVPAQQPPKQNPPEVSFLQPALDEQVLQPISVVEFSVRSESEISEVELWQSTKDGKTRIPLESNAASNADEGDFVVRHRVNIRLAPGLNSMDVFATNQGGEVSRSRFITYIEPPAIIQIESLRTEEGTVLENRAEVGQPRFDAPSPRAFVTLKGHVKLTDENDERWQTGRHYIHVWVNGFQQLPARLSLRKQPGESRLQFETPVLLGQSENLVQLSVPGLPRESRQQIVPVQCSQPLQDQRLHLLVIGVLPESNGQQLLDGALNTLRLEQYGVKVKSPSSRLVERYTTKANESGAKHVFREVFVYRPLTGTSANNRMISGHLGLVHRTIVELNAQRMKKVSRASDVVVVYYAGTERVRNDGYFHLATATKNQFLRSDLLSRFVHNTLGAHLLLLDVNRPVVTGGPLPHAAGISVLRLAQPQTHTMMTQLLADARPTLLEQFNSELRSRVRSIPGYPASAQYDGLIPQTMEKLQLAPD